MNIVHTQLRYQQNDVWESINFNMVIFWSCDKLQELGNSSENWGIYRAYILVLVNIGYVRQGNKSWWYNIFVVRFATNSMMSTLLETTSKPPLQNDGSKMLVRWSSFRGSVRLQRVYPYWHRTLWRSFLLSGRKSRMENMHKTSQSICDHIRRMHLPEAFTIL